MVNFKSLYSETVANLIKELAGEKENQILVILGDTTLLDTSSYQEYIDDAQTFNLHTNNNVFNQSWMTQLLISLTSVKPFHILSYAQYCYFESYFTDSLIQSRVVIIKDNLRQVFPLYGSEVKESSNIENLDERSEEMPIYQMDLVSNEDAYYYTVKDPDPSIKQVELFTDATDISVTYDNYPTINTGTEPYALDFFVNTCIRNNNFNVHAQIAWHKKKQDNKVITDDMNRVNHILNLFGGGLHLYLKEKITGEYEADDEVNSLLHKYWGEKAKFRSLSVYKNPDTSKELVEISQGIIVEKIINEYKNANKTSTNGTPTYRDLFLTAPTGAGKSLLFQLPSFYVSNQGDVTIVISPLIALMKDQVDAIIKERNFNKVAYLNSELSLTDREHIIENCKQGEIDVLYMSPELFMSYDITNFIGERKLGLMVIDEAHLITTWGRDFRVDYWHLGNHIHKIRKYSDYNFPMVAVTATAIYGGNNDMVFEGIDSLVMKNPHIYIGQVKRGDINFLINNYDAPDKNYNKFKITQTADFIDSIKDLGLKTLVYAPYTTHINKIAMELEERKLNIATKYYGNLGASNKQNSFLEFKNGVKNTMISTKAFGMGVDISDIQVVYHHAPSGLLPDYVQEIGRVARDPNIEGYAVLNYSQKDQSYSKALHGMSALKTFQIKEVIRKVYNSFLKNKKNRNLLLSVDDFAYIFDNDTDFDQKVITALMMIEKDYLLKHRFNVLIARPKKLFVKVYARLTEGDYKVFSKNYRNVSTLISKNESGYVYLELDLDKLWMKFFQDKGFPNLKREYYMNSLFKSDNIEVIPQLKFSLDINQNYDSTLDKLQDFLNKVKGIFSSFEGGYFTQEDFEDKLNVYINNKNTATKITNFILSSYTGHVKSCSQIEPYAFLQKKRTGADETFRVFNQKYFHAFTILVTRLTKLFENNNSNSVERFITSQSDNTINYIRLGSFLELLDLGSFEIKGGENPMVYVRINEPKQLEKDSKNNFYENILLNQTMQRHQLSMQIFDHFFLREYSNEERWNFIEDFFLGENIDTLINTYKGVDFDKDNKIDFAKYLEKCNLKPSTQQQPIEVTEAIHKFEIEDRFYNSNDLITIENDKGEMQTLSLSKWVSENPLLLHQSIFPSLANAKANIDKELFTILRTKVARNYPEYYKNFMGSRLIVDIDKIGKIEARIAIETEPLIFYAWWSKNKNEVVLGFQDKMKLFCKVFELNKNALSAKDKKMINK